MRLCILCASKRYLWIVLFFVSLFGRFAFCDVLFSEHQVEADDAIAKEGTASSCQCKVYGIRIPATSLFNGLNDVAEGTCARGPLPH